MRFGRLLLTKIRPQLVQQAAVMTLIKLALVLVAVIGLVEAIVARRAHEQIKQDRRERFMQRFA